jgi:uncharacterized membrane-anchored protein
MKEECSAKTAKFSEKSKKVKEYKYFSIKLSNFFLWVCVCVVHMYLHVYISYFQK